MGELLYKSATKILDLEGVPSVYAPIGNYKDLLPYLVRRLLENGANSSFINRLLDGDSDSSWLAENPFIRMKSESKEIPLPKKIFGTRLNSTGMDITEKENLDSIEIELKSFEGKLIHAHSIYEGRSKTSLSTNKVNSICNGIELGSVTLDDPTLLNKCLDNNNASNWKNINVDERAKILEKIADDIEEKPYELIYFLINEAGKTIQNAIDEIREGVDFLRYYSKEIIKLINNENQHIHIHE